jgi:hypothetical protein
MPPMSSPNSKSLCMGSSHHHSHLKLSRSKEAIQNRHASKNLAGLLLCFYCYLFQVLKKTLIFKKELELF